MLDVVGVARVRYRAHTAATRRSQYYFCNTRAHRAGPDKRASQMTTVGWRAAATWATGPPSGRRRGAAAAAAARKLGHRRHVLRLHDRVPGALRDRCRCWAHGGRLHRRRRRRLLLLLLLLLLRRSTAAATTATTRWMRRRDRGGGSYRHRTSLDTVVRDNYGRGRNHGQHGWPRAEDCRRVLSTARTVETAIQRAPVSLSCAVISVRARPGGSVTSDGVSGHPVTSAYNSSIVLIINCSIVPRTIRNPDV